MLPAMKRLEVFSMLGSALLAVLLCGCQALPPAHSASAASGMVRAGSRAEAEQVAQLFDALAPRVRELLPDSHAPDVEVWVQEAPALYRFSSSSYNDADGFWAASPHRIHLRRNADNLERTLAHELVHASLGSSWRTLPGTLEEGLCDKISGKLCPQGAARMRAGRLSSAGFATGGLELELEIAFAPELHPLGLRLSFSARMRLEGDPPDSVDPRDVFRVQAGLSSTAIPADRKKAFYGLAYLVVDRIVERNGFEGLHALCLRARAEGMPEVPAAWLMQAAEIEGDARSWNRAILDSIGPAELTELVRMHPDFLVETLSEFFQPYLDSSALEEALPWIDARLRIVGSDTQLALLSIPEIRHGLLRYAASIGERALASR